MVEPLRGAPHAGDAEPGECVVPKGHPAPGHPVPGHPAPGHPAAEVVPARLRGAQTPRLRSDSQPGLPREHGRRAVRAQASQTRRVARVPALADLLVQGLEHVAHAALPLVAGLPLHAPLGGGPLRAPLGVDEQRQELLLDVLDGADPVHEVRHLQAADLELLAHVQVQRGASRVAAEAKPALVVPPSLRVLLRLLRRRLAVDLLQVVLAPLEKVGVGERPRAVLNLAEALRRDGKGSGELIFVMKFLPKFGFVIRRRVGLNTGEVRAVVGSSRGGSRARRRARARGPGGAVVRGRNRGGDSRRS